MACGVLWLILAALPNNAAGLLHAANALQDFSLVMKQFKAKFTPLQRLDSSALILTHNGYFALL